MVCFLCSFLRAETLFAEGDLAAVSVASAGSVVAVVAGNGTPKVAPGCEDDEAEGPWEIFLFDEEAGEMSSGTCSSSSMAAKSCSPSSSSSREPDGG